MLEVRLEGIEEALDALRQLPTVSMEATVLRNAMKKSVKPMVEQANNTKPAGLIKAIAKTSVKEWQQSIRVSTRRRRGQSYGKGMVFINLVYAHPLAHIFEMGTVERYTKAGKSRGYIRSYPHVRPAFDANQNNVIPIFQKEIYTQLDKAAARLLKKAQTGKLTKGQARGLMR